MQHSLVIFQGPSASGKSTLQAHLGFPKVVTWTSRPARDGEVNGVDYCFATREEMLDMQEQGAFAELTNYNGNLYGTSLESIQNLFTGKDRRTTVMEAGGARILKALQPDKVLLIGVFAEKEDCRKRLALRPGQADAGGRLAAYEEEARALGQCDMIINNSDGKLHTARRIIDYLKEGIGQEDGFIR